MDRLLTPARLLLGAILLLAGLNHFLGPWIAEPAGTTPMAIQFMDALVLSRLIDVALAIQLVAGALLLAGLFVPAALAVAMPVNVCALFWALVLERSPTWGTLAVVVVALATLLMLAHLPAYGAMLARRPLAVGETDSNGGRYETLYANPAGQTRVPAFLAALLPLAGAAAFYHFIVPSMLAFYCIVMLGWPLCVLMLRTLQGLLVQPERGE